VDDTDFHVSWTASGPENFRTEVQLAGGDWSSLVGPENGLNVNNISTGEDTWDHGFGGLSAATTYDCRVRSEKDGVFGEWSTLPNVITNPTP